MQPLDLQLPDGNNLAGRSYDAVYFDIDSQHSVARVSQALEVPVISISRPSYGGSTSLATIADGRSTGEQQGQYLNTTILPAIWKKFGSLSGATSVVLLAPSIGPMVATVVDGCHIGTEGYPLAGLITSGIGVEHVVQSRQQMIQLLRSQTDPILLDTKPKDVVMLHLPHKALVDPAVCLHTERLNKPVPSAELHDINLIWLEHWRKYSTAIQIPLMYGLGEFGGLWSAFPRSPRVECGIVPIAPPCIEMSFQGTGWLYRCFGFACECAVSQGLLSESRDAVPSTLVGP
ncbi:hypothetical protein BDV36DRAFT_311363 [Aspergillus pseudocaelatus]|uniref:Uncharacterized protein n=1 Tax=Aspergillus pseudocaelatus TaxID=1825620 RepID=A0ABQ6WYT4_9EURO|nr:hypothetical protein BDV36DRAFT_311363 [Aspergillus pseudocaelatus]